MLRKLFILFLILFSVAASAQRPYSVKEDLDWINFMFKEKMGKQYNMRIENKQLLWDDGNTYKLPLEQLIVKVDEEKQRFYLECLSGNCISEINKKGNVTSTQANHTFKLKGMKDGNNNQTYFMGSNLRRAASMALGERPEFGKQQLISDAEKQKRPTAELIQEELKYLNQQLKIVEGVGNKALNLAGNYLEFDEFYGTARIPVDKVNATMAVNEKNVNIRCKTGDCIAIVDKLGFTKPKSEVDLFRQPYSGLVTVPETYVFTRRLNRLLKLQAASQKGITSTSIAEMENASKNDLNSGDKENQVRALCVKLQKEILEAKKLLTPIVAKDLTHTQRREKIKIASEAASKVYDMLSSGSKLLKEMEEAAKATNNAVKEDEAYRAANILSLAQNQIQLMLSYLAPINRYEEYSPERIADLEKTGKQFYTTAEQHLVNAYKVISKELIAANPSTPKKPVFASSEETRYAVDLETGRLILINYCMKQMQKAINSPELINALRAIPDQKQVCKHLEWFRADLKEHYADLDTAMMNVSLGMTAAEKLQLPDFVLKYKDLEKDLKTIRKNLDETMKLLPSKQVLETTQSEQLLLLIYAMKVPLDKAQDMVFDLSKKFPESYSPRR